MKDDSQDSTPQPSGPVTFTDLVAHNRWLTRTLQETAARLAALEDFVRNQTIDARGDTKETAEYLENIERAYRENIGETPDVAVVFPNKSLAQEQGPTFSATECAEIRNAIRELALGGRECSGRMIALEKFIRVFVTKMLGDSDGTREFISTIDGYFYTIMTTSPPEK